MICLIDSFPLIFSLFSEKPLIRNVLFNIMSDCDIQPTAYSKSKSMRKSYSPESNETFSETSDSRKETSFADDDVIMKTPQSLDDLLDIDNQNGEDQLDNENEQDLTCFSVDHTNTTEPSIQKKSTKKNGKLK